MLPNSTERGNSEELIEIDDKLKAHKKLSLVKIKWLEGAYQNPILTDSPAGHPTAGGGGGEMLEIQKKTVYFGKFVQPLLEPYKRAIIAKTMHPPKSAK